MTNSSAPLLSLKNIVTKVNSRNPNEVKILQGPELRRL